jgi:hypothetical protein
MRVVNSEILSTARPLRFRLAGFVAMAGGGLLLGLGALMEWVVLSFPAEIDPTGISAAPVRGTDVWEGKVVLGAAIVILVGTVATRLVAPTAPRRPMAVAIAVTGLVAAAIAIAATVSADVRFVATDGLDAYAEAIADDLGLPVEQIREELEEQVRATLEVDRGIGLWLASAGGVVSAVGGFLTLGWLRRGAPASPGAHVDEPASPAPGAG